MDERIKTLASRLLNFSVKLKKGETVLIDAMDVPENIVTALVKEAYRIKAHPFVYLQSSRVNRAFVGGSNQEQLSMLNSMELARFKKMDAYVAIRGADNIFELSDVKPAKMEQYMKSMRPSFDWRVKKTRWVVLRWPNAAMAQQSRMSTESFEDFYFKVCNLDYARMVPGMKALKKLMEKTDRVHIKGPGTDLSFSIKDIPAITCGGQFNIPDGEVFTAPVKNSVEGVISYNAPTVYQGSSFDNVTFEFEKGKIVKATSSDTKRLNKILDADAGARYVGEFAIGFNPFIKEPMRDILFDEKIAGSFHFTPGQAYEDADNGNRSTVHWDLVSIQRKDYGGGEIYFDDKLIRKDGLFVQKSLEKLNPEYLSK